MASVKLILDVRSKKKDGTHPIKLSVFHKKPRFINLDHSTSKNGWDEKNGELKKSVLENKLKDCDSINLELAAKLFKAKKVISEIGDSIDLIDVARLITHIKSVWDLNPNSELKKKVENEISLSNWGDVLIKRKRGANKPGTAKWYENGIDAIKKFNNENDIMLYDITVTFLKNFEAHHQSINNSMNTVSIYLRAIRSIYNSAVEEDQFKPIKNAFKHYKIPTGGRTKKRAVDKSKLMNIKSLTYKRNTTLWHTKNYALIMFYCRGMNFVDLVQIKVKDIIDNRLYYGRSKTGDRFSVKLIPELQEILNLYLFGKKSGDFLFPTNYDGSTKQYQKYKSQRRRMNERLRIIAKDAGIEGTFTTYYIRHSWATIAKYMGISTALISEGLGHSSIKTTEIYLKDFDDKVLDDANERIVA